MRKKLLGVIIFCFGLIGYSRPYTTLLFPDLKESVSIFFAFVFVILGGYYLIKYSITSNPITREVNWLNFKKNSLLGAKEKLYYYIISTFLIIPLVYIIFYIGIDLATIFSSIIGLLALIHGLRIIFRLYV